MRYNIKTEVVTWSSGDKELFFVIQHGVLRRTLRNGFGVKHRFRKYGEAREYIERLQKYGYAYSRAVCLGDPGNILLPGESVEILSAAQREIS